MFEKLKTPAFLRAAREGLPEERPVSLFKVFFVFLLVFMIAGMLQSFALTPVTLVLLFTDKEYLASFSTMTELPDEGALLDTVERLLRTDAVLVATLFATVFLGVAALFYCRSIEKRSYLSMGIRKKRAAFSSLLGAVLALLLALGAASFAHLFGAVTPVTPTRTDPLLFVLLLFGLFIEGFAEELLFRGYLTVSLARGRSLGFAVLLGALLYACFHRAGVGATPIAFLNFFLFGLLSSLYMIRFGNLLGTAVLHAVWSVGIGLVFGSPVSGNALPVSLLSLSPVEGSSFLSGGAFGLEGGIAVTCVLTLGVALLGMIPTKED